MQRILPWCRPGVLSAVLLLLSACSSGGGADASAEIAGRVAADGVLSGRVCADLNRNDLCDASEPVDTMDGTGAFRLRVPESTDPPLLAAVSTGSAPGDGGYRMASPSVSYSTTITPFTSLVHWIGEPSPALAEDLARDLLGLPTGLELRADPASPPADPRVALLSRLTLEWLQTVHAGPDAKGPIDLQRLLASLPAELSELPRLHITTRDTASIDSKETYIDARFELSHPVLHEQPLELDGRIRGRGNATWEYPKKPYRIQFTNNAGYAAITDVAGMKKNRHWVLLADYLDRSLMRNKLAFSLANSVLFRDGMKWNPSGVHVEVVLNGEYVGVYLLAENIRIGSSRLDIREMSTNPDRAEVDGGYVVEADARLDCYRDPTLDLQYVSPLGATRFCIDTPDEEDITRAQLQYIKAYLDDVERELHASGPAGSINAESFADWTLHNELFKNLDAPFLSSVFLWKGSDQALMDADRKLNLGPIWDFDVSAGNFDLPPVHMPVGCWVSAKHSFYDGANWLNLLAQKPEHEALLASRWMAIQPGVESFVGKSIAIQRARLQAAQARNFQRWDILGQKLVSHYTWNSWDEEVDFLANFLVDRSRWMSEIFSAKGAYRRSCD